ncbi:MAG: RDD family protein [Cryobacterium sp.]
MTEPRTDHRASTPTIFTGASPQPMHDASDDELVTGEAVALDVRPASMILRAAGALVDWMVYLLVYLGVVFLVSAVAGRYLDEALSRALMIASLVLAVLIIPLVVETASGGRSLGKMVIGARIVRDDGGAIGLRHAFIRSLLAVLEILMTLGGLAATTALLNSRSKRLGDLLAGTYSQHERVPRSVSLVHSVPLELSSWAETVDIVRLPDRLARRVAQFHVNADRLAPESRIRLADTLAAEVAGYVSPLPDVSAEALLLGVTAVRRDREYAALMLERDRLERLDPILTGTPHGFPRR